MLQKIFLCVIILALDLFAIAIDVFEFANDFYC
jgi:hypothetical protein